MELGEMRDGIDQCDREIIRLLNERARYAQEIGRIKRETGRSVFAPDRERAVYDKVLGLNEGPLSERSLHAIYREVMSGCIALERATRIGYFGPPGTFTHQAAVQKFGACMEYLPQPEIRDVFQSVSRGHADYGVVPIENSTEGSVTATSDMLLETELKILSEVFVEIHHNLLGGCALADVRIVLSHPQAVAQCRNWLQANLPGVPVREVSSTALAAERVRREEGAAAIASEVAAQLYELEVLAGGIEDIPGNMTRFIVVGRADDFGRPSGDDRTSLVFSTRHEAGSLYDALLPFKDNGVNMTRIESRPSKRIRWEYSFFVDLEGHATEPGIARALEALRERVDELVVLGSYPRAAHVVDAPPDVNLHPERPA